jgi:hypothetical protein
VSRVNVSSDKLALPVNDVIGYEAIKDAEILYLPIDGWRAENSFTQLMDHARSSDEASFISDFPSNIVPLTDNMPFFFQYEKPENIFKYKNSVIYNLFKSIAHISIFSVVLIFLPAYFLKKRHTRIRLNMDLILFFLCIGIGFILIEIGLIQKSVLFLGHPTYSFIAVVFSILIFSGLGSLASGWFRISDSRLIVASILVIVLFSFVCLFFMEDILNIILPENTYARMAMIGLFLAPLAFVMGIPFPKGLQVVGRRDENFIPLAMATNSVASVLGASASLPFAMLLGFSTIFMIAITVYFLGLVTLAINR